MCIIITISCYYDFYSLLQIFARLILRHPVDFLISPIWLVPILVINGTNFSDLVNTSWALKPIYPNLALYIFWKFVNEFIKICIKIGHKCLWNEDISYLSWSNSLFLKVRHYGIKYLFWKIVILLRIKNRNLTFTTQWSKVL